MSQITAILVCGWMKDPPCPVFPNLLEKRLLLWKGAVLLLSKAKLHHAAQFSFLKFSFDFSDTSKHKSMKPLNWLIMINQPVSIK